MPRRKSNSSPKAVLEEKVEGLGEIYIVRKASFDTALKLLNQKKTEIASFRDIAYGRIKTYSKNAAERWKKYEEEFRKQDPVFQDRNLEKLDSKKYRCYNNFGKLFKQECWVREAIVYIPGELPLLVRDSPLLELEFAEFATRLYNEDERFPIFFLDATKYIDEAEEDKSKKPQDRRVFILDNILKRPTHFSSFSIPTIRFGEEDITLWLFKDVAKRYGLFLKNEMRIGEIDIDITAKSSIDSCIGNPEKKPFLVQCRIGDPYYFRNILFDNRTLCGNYVNLRGILN